MASVTTDGCHPDHTSIMLGMISREEESIMEAQRFDHVVATLSQCRTRRRLLRGLGAALLGGGGVAVLGAPGTVHAKHHKSCPTKCPNGGCCHAGDTCCPPSAAFPHGACAPELNAVCCPPNDANPEGGFCLAGESCCPPSADFPLGACAPAGLACPTAASRDGRRVQGTMVHRLRPNRRHKDAPQQ
jgi:hypothetical protein